MSTLTTIPGRVLDQTLKMWRLPLTIAESTVRQDAEATAWPPHMAFERFEAGARETVGKLLGDQRLLDRAALQRAKLRQLDRAGAIDVQATAAAEQAQETLEQRRGKAEQRRTAARRTADERETALEREAQEAKSRAREAAAAKKKAAREQADRRAQSVKSREDADRRRQLDDEAAALAEKERAATEKARALDLEEKAAKAKAARTRPSGNQTAAARRGKG